MYCTPSQYQEVQKVALQLRIDYGHLEKELDVFKLAFQLNIELIKYSSLNEEQLEKLSKYDLYLNDGFTIFLEQGNDSIICIFYNDKLPIGRIRFTIAHEIKHVVFRETNPTIEEESLADHFARYILAPSFLLYEYIKTKFPVEQISEDFFISYETSNNAFISSTKRFYSCHKQLLNFEKEFYDLFLSNKKA